MDKITNYNMTDMESNYTDEIKPKLNKFTKDIFTNKKAVLKKVKGFPGNKELIKLVIEKGPTAVDQQSATICKEILDFVDFYYDGKIGHREIKYVGSKS